MVHGCPALTMTCQTIILIDEYLLAKTMGNKIDSDVSEPVFKTDFCADIDQLLDILLFS